MNGTMRKGRTMKITAFNASQWTGKSNTQVVVDEFLSGACDCGCRVESIPLLARQIKPCTGCFTCLSDPQGRCPLKDDMAGLIKKFVGSDIVVLATPVYMDAMTGLMKTFIDRLLPLLDPHFERDARGEYRHCSRYSSMPQIISIATAHMPEETHFQVIQLFMHRLARSLHTRIIAEIYRGTGGLLQSREESFRPYVREYKMLLREAGREIAMNGSISLHTCRQLDKPIASIDEYIKYANRMWDTLTRDASTSRLGRLGRVLAGLWA
jgi:multimeric flavodoxin WrbA